MIDIKIKDAYASMINEDTTDEFTEGVYMDLNYSVDYDGDTSDAEEYPMDHEDRYKIEYPETRAIVKLKLTTEGYALNLESYALAVDKASRMVEEKVISILKADKTVQKVWGDDIEKFLVSIPEEEIGMVNLDSENDTIFIKLIATVEAN